MDIHEIKIYFYVDQNHDLEVTQEKTGKIEKNQGNKNNKLINKTDHVILKI